MKPLNTFIIEHRQEGENHFLKFIPAVKSEGFPEKEISIIPEQWDLLRFHFALAYPMGEGNKEHLTYIP